MIAFSHKVNDVNLSFDISNLANCLKIKQVEIVNGDSYKTRGKFSICVAYDADIEDSFLIKESENRSTQSLGNVGRLIQFLTYKAKLVGKSVIKINGKHTNKKCCYCEKLRDIPSWKCVMICGCGNNIGRDQNSSINIMLRFRSQNALWTGYQQFVDNLRQYKIPD